MRSSASGAESTSCANRSVSLFGMRETQAEHGAGISVFHAHAAAMRLDGETAKREAEPASRARHRTIVALDLHEGIEDSLAHGLGHAGALVGNAELDGAVGSPARHADCRVFGSVAERVVEQIFEHAA